MHRLPALPNNTVVVPVWAIVSMNDMVATEWELDFWVLHKRHVVVPVWLKGRIGFIYPIIITDYIGHLLNGHLQQRGDTRLEAIPVNLPELRLHYWSHVSLSPVGVAAPDTHTEFPLCPFTYRAQDESRRVPETALNIILPARLCFPVLGARESGE